MQTFLWRFPDISCNQAYAMTFDMIIDSTLLVGNKLYADTGRCNDVPLGKYDLYSVFLHEFGHAIGLNHVNDVNSIMWFQQQTGLQGNQRKVWLHSDNFSTDGGIYMTTHSQDSQITVCGSTFRMTLLALTDCDTSRAFTLAGCLNNIDELNKEQIMSFPNPTSDFLTINFQKANINNFNLEINDLSGKETNSFKVYAFNNQNITIDVRQLPSGVYFGHLYSKNKVKYFKFLKQ